MTGSSNDFPDPRKSPSAIPRPHSAPLDLAFTLPVQAGYRELPPNGAWEDGYQLSLLALATIPQDSPIWEQRSARRVDVEFIL